MLQRAYERNMVCLQSCTPTDDGQDSITKALGYTDDINATTDIEDTDFL